MVFGWLTFFFLPSSSSKTEEITKREGSKKRRRLIFPFTRRAGHRGRGEKSGNLKRSHENVVFIIEGIERKELHMGDHIFHHSLFFFLVHITEELWGPRGARNKQLALGHSADIIQHCWQLPSSSSSSSSPFQFSTNQILFSRLPVSSILTLCRDFFSSIRSWFN